MAAPRKPPRRSRTASSRARSHSYDRFRLAKRAYLERVHRTPLRVVLLGSGGAGLERRRAIARELASEGILVVIPEDFLPRHVSVSVAEPHILSASQVDLVFIDAESWGPIAEFIQLQSDRRMAPRLRVLVPRRFHPLLGTSRGYMADLYLSHLAVFGHVYAVDQAGRDGFPTSRRVILRLARRYRAVKAFRGNYTK